MSSVSAFGSETDNTTKNNYLRTDSGNILDGLNNDEGFQEQRKKGRIVFRDSELTETFDDTDLWVHG